MQIIIADDEELARASVQSVLVQLIGEGAFMGMDAEGLEIAQVESGQKLIKLVPEFGPNIVFLDIQMPGLSGLDAMEALVAEYPGITWVILSGHADFSYAQRALRLGASAYLLKPVDPDEVWKVLDDFKMSLKRGRLDREMELTGLKLDEPTVEHSDSDSDSDEAPPALVRRTLAVAGRIFRLPVGVAQIAEELQVSPNHLSSEFKKSQGMSLTRHLTELRLEEAKRLMAHPGMTVKAAAEEVGYQGGRHFAKLFKEKYGLPPSEYLQSVDFDTPS